MKQYVLFLLLLFVSLDVSGQTFELEKFLDKAETATKNYLETFKNLSAEETKTNQYFHKDGTLDEKRLIKSQLIIYKSPRNGKINEFRYVLEYNGKNVARTDEDVAKFFEKLTQADNEVEEFLKIRNESNRFDGNITSWGMTLDEENPFGELRPFFAFKIVGREKIEEREAIIIEYTQIKATALISANPTLEELKNGLSGREYSTVLSKQFRPTNPRMSGKIWLDAETAQIWRNDLAITLSPSKLSKPVVSVKISYQYQPSEFGILVPKTFRFVNYTIFGSNDADLKVAKQSDRVFSYSKFSELKTEAKSYKINDQIN